MVMTKAIYRTKILVITLCSLMTTDLYAKEIAVGILLTPKQRPPYEAIFKEFTAETGISVRPILRNDTEYKEDIPSWLRRGTVDVLYWQASQRLFEYSKNNLIHSITHLWNEQNFDTNFSHVKDGVTYKGDIYALPMSYYHWGIFYKKSLLKRYDSVPTSWQEFIKICYRMQVDGITPFGLGSKDNWPAAAWFDYLNLRINGLKFHRLLLSGKVSFHDARVQAVLIEWKGLVDNGFFNTNHSSLYWDQVLPVFYREKIGFILIGNFVFSKWSSAIIDDIGFMPFPKIKPIPQYEEAPMDVFMISKNTQQIEEAEEFIKFMARSDIQAKHNKALGYLPPNKSATVSHHPLIQVGSKLLNQAAGLSYYFDRDTSPAFDKLATPILAEFITSGDLIDTTSRLEQARLQAFK